MKRRFCDNKINSFKTNPRVSAKTEPDIRSLLAAAHEKRIPIMPLAAYRLFNSEYDGLKGLVIDIYNDSAAVSWYLESALAKKEKIIDALVSKLPVTSVYELYRFKSPGAPQNYNHIYGGKMDEFFTVRERSAEFLCSYDHGQNTGFFIDNRANRDILFKMAAGKKTLNLFSYTGVLSVVAASGGAGEVTSVDISPAYNRWARRNLELNGFGEFAQKVLDFDALEYMNFCAKKNKKFDLVILDPPPFAARLAGKVFSAGKDYRRLVDAALKIVSKNSVILALCNMAEYDRRDFALMLHEAVRESGAAAGFKITAGPPMPPDFKCDPGDKKLNYLKNYYIEVY
ncbi:MAG TPA: class I SAM-dependent methyltransferase [Candidatus Wallbacteria bacterium]|nr:class I SAM-dependent methyltransferase [Candidatus Wallbacteria bacterium]